MSQLQQMSVRNRLLAALAPDDFGLLQPHLEPVRLEFRQIVIEANEPIQHVSFIERGIVSILANAPEGRVEVGIVGREGIVGVPLILGSDRSPYSYLVQAEGEALRITAQDLRTAIQQSPSINAVLGRYIHALLVQTAQTAYANASFNIEARLARWILMTQDRIDGNDLPLTHDFLAMMLGVRRPGVTTATHVLEGAKIIRATRGQITVLDREKLEDLADDSYGIAEAEYARLVAEV
jgi:CRP-like cAMP-binding protein